MRVLLIAVPGGVFVTGILWWLTERLSSDAVAMMIGLMFGVLSLVPTVLLVTLARRRDEQDEYIDIRPAPSSIVYQNEVTPYTHLARRVGGLSPLSDRQADIDMLRAALAYLESGEVRL
jgi:hypothetical protein